VFSVLPVKLWSEDIGRTWAHEIKG
jgi:hypothetical protein